MPILTLFFMAMAIIVCLLPSSPCYQRRSSLNHRRHPRVKRRWSPVPEEGLPLGRLNDQGRLSSALEEDGGDGVA